MRNYAPVSLKSAQDLVRVFPVFVGDKIPTTSNQKTLESNRVGRARHNHEINAFRERSQRIMYLYVRTSSYVVRSKTWSGMYRYTPVEEKHKVYVQQKMQQKLSIFTQRVRIDRHHFPVLVPSNTLGIEVRSNRCLVGALGGMLCVRQHQCDHVATAKQTHI